MGEILYSILIGGFLVLSGIFMNIYLRWEEKSGLLRTKGERNGGGA